MLNELLKKMAPEFGLFEGENDEEASADIESKIEQEVIGKLDRSKKLDEVETVTFGLETDDGKIVKVYIKAEQAEDFEKALSAKLGEVDDIEEALNELSKEFEIVDVDWPDEEEDEKDVDDVDAADDGSSAMNADVYQKSKDAKDDTKPKMENLNTGEQATLYLLEGDGSTVESRLNTSAQLMVYHAILELGIPEVALNRNPYRTAIIKGIRDVAYQLSRNTAMKQALKMFVKKSIDHDEKPNPEQDDEVQDKNPHGKDAKAPKDTKEQHKQDAHKPVKEGQTLDESRSFLIEGVAQDFWSAFNTIVKYVSPDVNLTKNFVDSSKMQQLLSRSSGALTSRVNSSLRMRLNDLVKAISADDGATTKVVAESATVDEVGQLLSDMLTLADPSKDSIQAKAIISSSPYRQLLTKLKIQLSQKFNGQVRTKLNALKTVMAKTTGDLSTPATSSTVAESKLVESAVKWEIEREEDGLAISCGYLKMTLGEEDAEKLAKSVSNKDAVVVKDLNGKKFVFSPRGLLVQVKAVGGTSSYVMEIKDVDKLIEVATAPAPEPEDDTGEEDSGREADDAKVKTKKEDVKEALATMGLGAATENKPGMKTWSYEVVGDWNADCKRLKYTSEKQGDKLIAKNILGARVGEFSEAQKSGWLRQK